MRTTTTNDIGFPGQINQISIQIDEDSFIFRANLNAH